ncbi:MAG TPA: hypothetical protein VLX28_11705, partial [Thermoanaerobaculia bacterium]|nr:hypothetical protein [Thermoanaerobaculia bacterium]
YGHIDFPFRVLRFAEIGFAIMVFNPETLALLGPEGRGGGFSDAPPRNPRYDPLQVSVPEKEARWRPR